MTIRLQLQLLAAALVFAIIAPSFASTAAGEHPAAGGVESAASTKEKTDREPRSLDDELLKDLGPDSLPGEDDAAQSSAKKMSDDDPLDRELLKGLDDGEDIGSPGEQNPLARLNKEMREVEALMARRQSGDETRRLQAQIVSELEELIRKAQQPSRGGGSSSAGKSGKGSQQTANRRKVTQPGKRQGEGAAAGDVAARQSSKRTRDEAAQKPDMANMRDLLKGVWGQLPERQREQMLQSYEEQFLPKYEQMIADYFRSIAEERER
jgi:hypothetical protein